MKNIFGSLKKKNIFGDLNMSWLRMIIFAVVAGVYTGAVMLVPLFENTSFQDIGISYECWVVFAVIVVTNCKKPVEAMLKCFIFFVISQPLVYAVEVIFGDLAFETALGYYLHIWLPATFLTLPGGLIAFFCKKQNLLGSIIMGLGNTIQYIMGAYYVLTTIAEFPDHLLTAVFCFVSAVVMALMIQKEKKYRIISLVLPLVLTALIIAVIKMNGLYFASNSF